MTCSIGSLLFQYVYAPEHDYVYLTRDGAMDSEVDVFTLAPPPHNPITVHIDVEKSRELFGIEIVGARVSLPTAIVERLENAHKGNIDLTVEFSGTELGGVRSEIALKLSEQPPEGSSRLTVMGDSLECICSWDADERVVALRFIGDLRVPAPKALPY